MPFWIVMSRIRVDVGYEGTNGPGTAGWCLHFLEKTQSLPFSPHLQVPSSSTLLLLNFASRQLQPPIFTPLPVLSVGHG